MPARFSYRTTFSKQAGISDRVASLIARLGSNSALSRMVGGAALGGAAGGAAGGARSLWNDPTDWRKALKEVGATAGAGAVLGGALGGFQGKGLHNYGKRGADALARTFNAPVK